MLAGYFSLEISAGISLKENGTRQARHARQEKQSRLFPYSAIPPYGSFTLAMNKRSKAQATLAYGWRAGNLN